MTPRENLLKAVRFETPDYIPMSFYINPACWHHYPQQALHDLMADHPFLFPNFKPTTEKITPNFGPNARADQPYTDDWGCTWHTSDDGITGSVPKHPLQNWDDAASYIPPDPQASNGLASIDWTQIAANLENARATGQLCRGGLRHGHTFLQLCDIRGYENLMFDMIDDEPKLHWLIKILEDFNMAIVNKFLQLGVEWMSYPEDLGMQVGPMLSPDHFRKYIKPSFQRLMAPARQASCIVHMHSDGDIRQLVDDLIDGGVEIINLQDLVNGIDWIADKFAGKVCIDLDVDRQSITPHGSPKQIDSLIREEVTKLGSKKGGLTMLYGMYPGVPLQNAKAIMDAMEKYATFYS